MADWTGVTGAVAKAEQEKRKRDWGGGGGVSVGFWIRLKSVLAECSSQLYL